MVLWGSGERPWASWGALGGSVGRRSASWSLRDRFPGLSAKFQEAFWIHFGSQLDILFDFSGSDSERIFFYTFFSKKSKLKNEKVASDL